MTEKEKHIEDEAHRKFAVMCFNQIWSLLEKENRTKKEDQEMIHLAHASFYHWMQVGKPINEQRGEWMLARVYTVLKDKGHALKHAKKCLKLTEEHRFRGFDLAYSNESMARASALNNDSKNYEKYYAAATSTGELIEIKEDRDMFFQDLQGEPWFGFK